PEETKAARPAPCCLLSATRRFRQTPDTAATGVPHSWHPRGANFSVFLTSFPARRPTDWPVVNSLATSSDLGGRPSAGGGAFRASSDRPTAADETHHEQHQGDHQQDVDEVAE